MHLKTLQWVPLDLGGPLAQKGSWNRGIMLDPSRNIFAVFGNKAGDMLEDYNKRSCSFSHFISIDLEAFGIFPRTTPAFSSKQVRTLLDIFDAGLSHDFEVVCVDGRKVPCSRALLESRWPWFKTQRDEFVDRVVQSRSPTTQGTPGKSLVTVKAHPTAQLRNSQLHFSTEQYPVVVALVQYFYTLFVVP